MVPGTANYTAHRRGDTINARTITIQQDSSPLDITTIDVQADFTLRDQRIKRRVGNGITKTDPANGVFSIDQFSLGLTGLWSYDVQLIYADGTVRTIIVGSIEIVQDVTL